MTVWVAVAPRGGVIVGVAVMAGRLVAVGEDGAPVVLVASGTRVPVGVVVDGVLLAVETGMVAVVVAAGVSVLAAVALGVRVTVAVTERVGLAVAVEGVWLAVAVPVALGCGEAEGLGLGLGSGSLPSASYAPMSQRARPSASPSSGRGLPRWSVPRQPAPASTAWLPRRSACVEVRPPLFSSGPRRTSASSRSPGASKAQLFPISRL